MPKRTQKTNDRAADEKFFSAVLHLAHDAIIVMDEDQKIIVFNEGAERIFGYKTSEVTGQPLDLLLPQALSEVHRAHVRKFAASPDMARQMDERLEISGRRKDGSIFPAEAGISKIPFEGRFVFVAILRDITERKQAEEALRKSEETHRMVLNGIDEIVYQVRQMPEAQQAGIVEFVSERTQEILGYRPGDFIVNPHRWFDLIHPEDIPALQAQTAKIVTSGRPGMREYRIKDINGNYRWMEDRVSPGLDETGRVVRIYGVVRDVTEQKRAVQTLKEREKQYHDLFESTSDLIQAVAPDGRLLFANRAWREALGYTEQELINLNIDRVVHPEALTQCFETLQRTMSGEQIDRIETRFVTKEGKSIVVEGSVTCRFEAAQPMAITCFLRDITKRKQAEDLLRQSEGKYRTLIEQAADGIFVADAEGNHVEVNSRGCEMLGYTRAEILQLKIGDLLESGEVERAPLRMDELRQGKTILTERVLIRKDESAFPAEISVKILPGGQLQAIVRDITERKRAEQQVQTLLEAMPDGVIAVSAEGSIVVANAQAEALFGYTREELLGQPIEMLLPERVRAIHPRHREGYLATPKTRTMGSGLELYAHRKDGSEFPVDISLSAVETGHGRTAISVIRDITERKLEEQALRLAEEKYRAIFENVHEGIYQTTPEGRFINANPALARLLGYASPEELIATVADIGGQSYVDPAQREEFKRLLEEHDTITGLVSQSRRKDGGVIWVSENAHAARDESGKLLYYEGTVVDITERKQAEAERAQLLNVLETSLNEIYIFDPESLRFQYVNQGALRNLGYSREAMRAMTPLDIKPEFDEVSFRRLIEPLLRREQEQLVFHTVHRRADDSRYPVEIHLQLSDYEGKRSFHAIVLDITERKQAEEVLRKRDERHRKVIENIFRFVPEGLLVFTENLSLVKQNKAFEEITRQYAAQLGYTEQELADLIAEQARRKILSGDTTEIHIPRKHQ